LGPIIIGKNKMRYTICFGPSKNKKFIIVRHHYESFDILNWKSLLALQRCDLILQEQVLISNIFWKPNRFLLIIINAGIIITTEK
jgi:hypothetical protein